MRTQTRQFPAIERTPLMQASLVDAIVRARAEFREMPGLALTKAQAQRLWCLDVHTCEHVLDALLSVGFLRQTTDGRYLAA